MSTLTEHQKLHAVKAQSQAIGQFLEWLQGRGTELADYHGWLLWAFISDRGQLMPATIREKAGDAEGELRRRHGYRHSPTKEAYRLVRIRVTIEPSDPTPVCN